LYSDFHWCHSARIRNLSSRSIQKLWRAAFWRKRIRSHWLT
jgi:hypothetical protein